MFFRESRRQSQNKHITFNIFCLENPAIYEAMWKNIVKLGKPQIKIWRMRIA
jgi:hypothetical protein